MEFKTFVNTFVTIPAQMLRTGRRLTLKAAEGWQTITLPARDFKTAEGELLANWQKIQLLELEQGRDSGPTPSYAEFRWIK